VGGGIGGLATALALRQENPRVLEAAPRYGLQSYGAAVQITPEGMTSLRSIGGEQLFQLVLKEGAALRNSYLIQPSKETLFDNVELVQERPEDDLPTIMIRWARLRHLLEKDIESDLIEYEKRVTSYHFDESGHHLETGSGDTIVLDPGCLVIAADGKNSLFRPEKLRYQLRLNIKAAIENPGLPEELQYKHGNIYSILAPSDGLACFLGPASSDGWVYWSIAMSFSSQQELDTFREMSTENLKLELFSRLETASQEEVQLFCPLILKSTDIFVQPTSDIDSVASLLPDGVVLVGDAAHPMTGAYGAATSFALEDAHVLSECLAAHNLEQYSRTRRGKCADMIKKSRERANSAMSTRSKASDD